jgi:hypothetical protein
VGGFIPSSHKEVSIVQPFVNAGVVGCGLHDRGISKMPVTERHVGHDTMWQEVALDTYMCTTPYIPCNSNKVVRIERVNESMFIIGIFLGEVKLFHTWASDIWEAKIIGDMLFAMMFDYPLKGSRLMTLIEEVFHWDETFAQRFMNFYREATQAHITTRQSSSLGSDSYLKELLLQNGAKEVSASTNLMEGQWPVQLGGITTS